QSLWGSTSPYPFQALVGLLQYPTRISGWLHGSFWFLAVGLLVRYRKTLPLGEMLFCAGALVISTQQESFHGVYRYLVPLIPLTMAVADDRTDVRHAFIAFNIIFGVVMILAFVTGNRITIEALIQSGCGRARARRFGSGGSPAGRIGGTDGGARASVS